MVGVSERTTNGGTGFFDGVFDRTLGNLRAAWRDIAESARVYIGAGPRPDLPDNDAERLRAQMRACLEGKGGQVSARARAAELGRTYLALSPTGQERFLRLLAEEFDLDRDAVDAACERLMRAEGEEERRQAEQALREALQPPRTRLLTQFNALPEGVKFLVDLRSELMALGKRDAALAGLEQDLKNLLASWFDVGFLELQRITWESPAALLEKLIAYEAVHAIRSWTDLKNRLEADRRCFAFFHPRMPHEPLIFVEVALVSGMASNVQKLLDEHAPLMDPSSADTAIFYSISNCQRGLAGISLGDFLIKRVVDQLAKELPKLRTFATLSPIPGFRKWLDGRLAEGAEPRLRQILETPSWHLDEDLAKEAREPLTRLCARYLVLEKGRGGRALDPVAHFHLSNGARIERLNWLGDTSPKGLEQSAGMMVNYLYKLSDIEANHEAYTGEARVTASLTLRNLAAKA
jgi:malonyl-CoA decarboxylase